MPTHNDTLPIPPSDIFSHGPYTDTGDPAAVTPMTKSSKRWIWFLTGLVFVIGCTAGATMKNNLTAQPDERKSLPVCDTVDGTTQDECILDNAGGRVLNLDYGSYMYDLTNNTLTQP